MNRMADGVLKEMDENQKKEDQMIEKYQRLRELKLRKDEDRKKKMKDKAMIAMCEELAKQQRDKRQRAIEEKKDRDQQATMWQKERTIWKDEDKRLKEKIAKINGDTKAFLNKQMAEKVAKKSKHMDEREQRLNKALMKEIKAKKATLEA